MVEQKPHRKIWIILIIILYFAICHSSAHLTVSNIAPQIETLKIDEKDELQLLAFENMSQSEFISPNKSYCHHNQLPMTEQSSADISHSSSDFSLWVDFKEKTERLVWVGTTKNANNIPLPLSTVHSLVIQLLSLSSELRMLWLHNFGNNGGH